MNVLCDGTVIAAGRHWVPLLPELDRLLTAAAPGFAAAAADCTSVCCLAQPGQQCSGVLFAELPDAAGWEQAAELAAALLERSPAHRAVVVAQPGRLRAGLWPEQAQGDRAGGQDERDDGEQPREPVAPDGMAESQALGRREAGKIGKRGAASAASGENRAHIFLLRGRAVDARLAGDEQVDAVDGAFVAGAPAPCQDDFGCKVGPVGGADRFVRDAVRAPVRPAVVFAGFEERTVSCSPEPEESAIGTAGHAADSTRCRAGVGR